MISGPISEFPPRQVSTGLNQRLGLLFSETRVFSVKQYVKRIHCEVFVESNQQFRDLQTA